MRGELHDGPSKYAIDLGLEHKMRLLLRFSEC